MTVSDDDAKTSVARHRTVRTSAPVGFRLSVVTGPDTGETLEVDPDAPGPLLVGQGPACALRLTDRQVSRRHLALEISGGALAVRDLDSTNGTRVGGLEVVEARLRGGEKLVLGATTIDVQRDDRGAPSSVRAESSFGHLLGESPAMRRLYPLCARLAAASVPVVIEGETGTGKEVLAESLHEMGPRASGPFAVFDCTAVPPNLLEAALFGHERGAFTGATEARQGVFEEAHKGTLLIDEIGDLGLELQAKLLRALERSEVRRLGGKSWIKVDVRVVAATRRDLDAAVQAGRFRDDLFYRLAVARIELPPLRRREGDVAMLAEAFWKKLADPGVPIPPDFLERLETYSWPGNVRELYNAVARQVALGDLAMTTPESRPAPAREGSGGDAIDRVLALDLPLPRAKQRVVEELEMRYVERVLAQHGGNVTRAAAASGIALRYFQLVRARTRARTEGA